MFELNNHARYPRLEANDHAAADDVEWEIPTGGNPAVRLQTVLVHFDASISTIVQVKLKRPSPSGDKTTVIYAPEGGAETIQDKVIGFEHTPITLMPGDTLIVNQGHATNAQITVMLRNGDA